MAERDLKKLSRADLLEMLLEITRENEELQRKVEELQARLSDRELNISVSGSIAEAALKINEVFEAADAAAKQYLENVKRVHSLPESAGEECDP